MSDKELSPTWWDDFVNKNRVEITEQNSLCAWDGLIQPRIGLENFEPCPVFALRVKINKENLKND